MLTILKTKKNYLVESSESHKKKTQEAEGNI